MRISKFARFAESQNFTKICKRSSKDRIELDSVGTVGLLLTKIFF